MTSPISPAESANATTLFRKDWSLYDTVVAGNCMFHREIYALVGDLLSAFPPGYRVLDLGCGNARCVALLLRTHPPASYLGIDLSEAALAEASGYLQGVPGVCLETGDLLALTKALPENSVDAVLSGFALHHLTTQAKKDFFLAVYRVLLPSGRLLLVDIARRKHETREQYLERYLSFMRGWSVLDERQIEEACSHVAQYDFPEPLSDLLEMGRLAGFQSSTVIAGFGDHHVMEFLKS